MTKYLISLLCFFFLLFNVSSIALPPSEDIFSTETEDVIFESSLPQLNITYPKDGQILDTSSLNIEGTAKNISLLVVNGEVVPLHPNGQIKAFAQLREGDNLLRFLGYSKLGQEVTVNRVVKYIPGKSSQVEQKAIPIPTKVEQTKTRETVSEKPVVNEKVAPVSSSAPKLVVNLPKDPLVLSAHSIIIQGKAQDVKTLLINDNKVSLMNDMSYAYALPLKPGINRFEIKAIGADKQMAVFYREVQLQVPEEQADTKTINRKVASQSIPPKQESTKKAASLKKSTKPAIKPKSVASQPTLIVNLPAYKVVKTKNIGVSGVAKGVETLLVHGKKVSIRPDNKFYVSIPLSKGLNIITVKGYSSAKVFTKKVIKVKRL